MVSNQTILIGIISVLTVAGSVYYYNESKNKDPSKKNKSNIDPKLVKLIVGTLVLLFVLGGISFKYFLDEKKVEFSLTNMSHWLNRTSIDATDPKIPNKLQFAPVMAGMAFGVIFGFIDNAGLFFGMDALDPHVQKISTDPKVSAGIGNTFSDVIGAFAGTFAGNVIKQILDNKLKDQYAKGIPEGPMWADAIGIFIGCILGIIIPSAMVS